MPIWILFSILLGLYNSQIVHKSFRATRNTIFDDFVVPQYISQELFCVDGLFDCFLICSDNPKCQTFFYNELKRYCQVSTVVFFFHANWQDAKGMRYYETFTDDCPKNAGYIYNKANNLCFKIHDSDKKRWLDARETCKREGGDLLVLDTMEKFSYIQDTIHASPLLSSNKSFIGASDADMEGVWRWINGVPLSLMSAMWAKYEPNDIDGHDFATMRQYLDTENGETARVFFCEIDIPIN